MRLCLAFIRMSLVSAALVCGTLPATAKPSDSQDNFPSEVERWAATLIAQSADALNAALAVAARTVQDAKETDAAQQFQEFGESLNARKAQLDSIGKDAAARFEAWKQSIDDWLDTWPGRSATEAIDRFRDWLKTHSAPDDPEQISV